MPDQKYTQVSLAYTEVHSLLCGTRTKHTRVISSTSEMHKGYTLCIHEDDLFDQIAHKFANLDHEQTHSAAMKEGSESKSRTCFAS